MPTWLQTILILIPYVFTTYTILTEIRKYGKSGLTHSHVENIWFLSLYLITNCFLDLNPEGSVGFFLFFLIKQTLDKIIDFFEEQIHLLEIYDSEAVKKISLKINDIKWHIGATLVFIIGFFIYYKAWSSIVGLIFIVLFQFVRKICEKYDNC